MSLNRIYFPGLNGVRFLAVFIVMLDHIELFKGYLKIDTLWTDSFSAYIGKFGVTIFFVLSGFLITYLLLVEKTGTQTISIKNFYLRRILRIWPLYFILVILGFFILPYFNIFTIPETAPIATDFYERLLLYVFLLANVAFVFFPGIPFAGVLWSVAVEEQFYLFWPHLIKHSKKILFVLLTTLVVYLLIKISCINNCFNADKIFMNKLVKLIERTRFSSMIIGGIGAWVLFNKKQKILAIVYHPLSQVIAIFIFVIMLFYSNTNDIPYFNLIKNEFISLIVAILILNIASNKSTIIRLENKLFDFLGKISYGMYVYHSIIALVCVKLFTYFLPTSDFMYILWSIILILLVLLLTVIISYFSYHFIELKILKRKNRFSHVISGDLSKEK
jgi:peptidoglycan/LPS O-acetylase OafA/YrhL